MRCSQRWSRQLGRGRSIFKRYSWEAKSIAKQEVFFGVRLFSAAPRKFF